MSTISRLWARYVGPYLKAHVAGLGAGLSVLATDASGNIANVQYLTLNQWIGVLAATGLLGSVVGFLGNRPAPVAVAAPAVEVAAVPVVSQDSGA